MILFPIFALCYDTVSWDFEKGIQLAVHTASAISIYYFGDIWGSLLDLS